jgi:transcriptional regulator with XRE-family HTH domain
LPDELDPQVREFASQLRRLVDRSGLSIAAVADRTGYSKTSWERYLNGRLLAPKGAIVALAEVTGTNPTHLTTMWELAERAWSRSEMRHDMTMEAIRISQARAALGEFGGEVGAPPANAQGSRTARRGATATPGVAGPAGVVPSVPPQPRAPDARDSAGGVRELRPQGGANGTGGSSAGPSSGSPGGNSWGMAGYQGPSRTGSGRPVGASSPASASSPSLSSPSSSAASSSADGPGRTAAPAAPYGESPRGPRSGGDSSGGAGGKRRLTMFLAGIVGAAVVVAAAFVLTDGGDDGKKKDAAASPSPSVSSEPDLPPGVKCSGDSCTGKDAESMGCSGDLVTTAQTATVGTTVVEVRYSETCGAAWGRITRAVQGDEVTVTAGKSEQNGTISVAGDTIAYTPMVAVKDAGDAKACVALAAGREGCTR